MTKLIASRSSTWRWKKSNVIADIVSSGAKIKRPSPNLRPFFLCFFFTFPYTYISMYIYIFELYNTIRYRRSNALNPLSKDGADEKRRKRTGNKLVEFFSFHFIVARSVRWDPRHPCRSLGVWMAIDFPLSSSASLLLTTNIHEVIRVIDIHWATVEADDIKCVMLARGSGNLTHALVLCACIRTRYAHCTSRPLRTPWYIDDWSLPLSLEETTKLLVFKNPSVFCPSSSSTASMTIHQRCDNRFTHLVNAPLWSVSSFC